tara:strand:- start:65 stop:1147 length:1083 start_codon:yes stop_codon:yes gene_type:complete
MKEYNIVMLPGDGIGPEISNATKPILHAISKKNDFHLNIKEEKIGGASIDETDIPLTERAIATCQESDAVLLAAIGSPKYDKLPRNQRPETGLLNLRNSLKLFANIRPVKVIPALIDQSSLKSSVIENVDLVVVRELIGGIYFGKPKGLIKTEDEERAFNTMTYSTNEIKRIANVAFNIANTRKKKVSSIDKANVLDVSQLWREIVTKEKINHPGIILDHFYIDNAAMQLVKDPSQFDVILTGNLFGDILSDQAAMLTGSIGMLPSASLGSNGPGLFEPVHGSAPDIAGQDKANPIAMILSAAMMFRTGLKETTAADQIQTAVNKVLNNGYRTLDIAGDPLKALGCIAMGEEILKEINAI